MPEIKIVNDSVYMSLELFEDILDQLNVDYSIHKHSIEFKTPFEQNNEDVEIDIDDEEFLKLAKMAHANDITFNQLCNNLLQDYVNDCCEDCDD